MRLDWELAQTRGLTEHDSAADKRNPMGMKHFSMTLYETNSIGEIKYCVGEDLSEYDSVGDNLFLHYEHEFGNDLIMQ